MNELDPKKNELDKSILNCIAYFDIFKHPITREEIFEYLDTEITFQNLSSKVEYFVEKGIIEQYGEYLALKQAEKMSVFRTQYEANARKHHAIAIKNGQQILKLPFVSGVCISGSLSKGVMKPDADIDYFIIGKERRIWLAKSFIKLYKYFFLKNSKEYFCTNYFISDGALSIKEKNRYTATELATLIPLASEDLYRKLLSANAWWKSYLPNYILKEHILTKTMGKHITKPKSTIRTEYLLSGYIGSLLNIVVMKSAVWRNKLFYNKQKKHVDFDLMFRSTVSEIKVHGSNHQINTLNAHKQSSETLDLLLENL